jgi:hypothetical protein
MNVMHHGLFLIVTLLRSTCADSNNDISHQYRCDVELIQTRTASNLTKYGFIMMLTKYIAVCLGVSVVSSWYKCDSLRLVSE